MLLYNCRVPFPDLIRYCTENFPTILFSEASSELPQIRENNKVLVQIYDDYALILSSVEEIKETKYPPESLFIVPLVLISGIFPAFTYRYFN
jgi:hypothetical protein